MVTLRWLNMVASARVMGDLNEALAEKSELSDMVNLFRPSSKSQDICKTYKDNHWDLSRVMDILTSYNLSKQN